MANILNASRSRTRVERLLRNGLVLNSIALLSACATGPGPYYADYGSGYGYDYAYGPDYYYGPSFGFGFRGGEHRDRDFRRNESGARHASVTGERHAFPRTAPNVSSRPEQHAWAGRERRENQ